MRLLFEQVYHGSKNTYQVDDLKPETSYSFRVHAVRYLSEVARSSVPTANAPSAEVKGVFSTPLLRAKTCSVKEMEELNEAEAAETEAALAAEKAKQQKWCNLTDTNLALIFLGTFLVLCALIAGALRWVMGEFQF